MKNDNETAFDTSHLAIFLHIRPNFLNTHVCQPQCRELVSPTVDLSSGTIVNDALEPCVGKPKLLLQFLWVFDSGQFSQRALEVFWAQKEANSLASEGD